jgi:hypothetical protein
MPRGSEPPVAVGDLKWSMLPDRYPIDGGWIDLDLITLDLADLRLKSSSHKV